MTVAKATGWQPVLDSADVAATLAIAKEVGRRLSERDRVETAVQHARSLTDEPRLVHWRSEGLWQGYAGLALLSAMLDDIDPDAGWDLIGRDQIRSAATALEEHTERGAGLAAAVRGVAAAAQALSRGGTRYVGLQTTLDEALADLASDRCAAVLASAPHGVTVSTYDVIGGLAGVGRHLLDRRDTTEDALLAVLHSLVRLSATDAGGVAHWYTPVDRFTGNFLPGAYPEGHVNLGLAHGVPGPLALMSVALTAGAEVDGQRDAVHRTADAIAGAQLSDRWGATFPIVAGIGSDAIEPTPGRNAWCYGPPGVARALWLAGTAVDREDLCDLAVETMLAVGRRPVGERRIDSPTLCHGVAGLLAITLRFAADTRRPEFGAAARDLARRLVDAFEPETTFGYRNLEPSGSRIDHPGVLDGAAGVALVLLAAAASVEPRWDSVLLLS